MARLQSRQISQLHLYRVLHAVRLKGGPMSRAEICEATGLSQPAVSSLTRRLLETGALSAAGARPSSGGGRRETELVINAAFAWVAGAKLSMHQLTITLADFAGRSVHTVKLPLAAPMRPADLVRRLARDVDRMLREAGPPVRERLAGVGVAVPGFVDSIAGDVLWSPVLRSPGKRVADALARSFGVPAFVENDANMLALAEQWFGDAGRLSNLAVVTLEHGLGLGLVLSGELHRGHSGLAAELGHVQIEPGGRPCRCGKLGCLEAYVAHEAIVRQGLQAGLLPGIAIDGPGDIEAAYLRLAESAADRPEARAIFEQQGRLLGQWVANVVNLFAPQLVVLGGGPPAAARLYEPALRAAMDAALALPHRGRVPLVVRHHGDEVWARGAAALVLQRIDASTRIVEAAARHGFEGDSVPRNRPSP